MYIWIQVNIDAVSLDLEGRGASRFERGDVEENMF